MTPRDRQLDALLQELGKLAAEVEGQAEPPLEQQWPLSEARLERIVDAALQSLQPGDLVANEYKIERALSADAVAETYAAIDLRHSTPVAIHLYPWAEGGAAERLLREARAASRIAGEHVLRVLDCGTWERGSDGKGTPFIVTEHVEGHDLLTELEEQGPLPVERAVDCALQVVDALTRAHSVGIVHRELRPEYIFLTTREDGRRAVKVFNFGMLQRRSSLTNDSPLDERELLGSLSYMSPEQIEQSGGIDVRADIWAVGAILHQLVLGELPFQGDTWLHRLRAVLAGERQPLTMRLGVPEGLERAVTRCLRRDPQERFASATELGMALRPFGSGTFATRGAPREEVSAATPRRWRLSQYWPVASAAALVALVGAAVWAELEGERRAGAGSEERETAVSAIQPVDELREAEARPALPGASAVRDLVLQSLESPPSLTSGATKPSGPSGLDALMASPGVQVGRAAPASKAGDATLDDEERKRLLKQSIGLGKRRGSVPFSLEEATEGLGEAGTLLAKMHTDRGVIECELWPERAPLTVANFVGLARGLRPFREVGSGAWVQRPFYDGTVFHRVIPGALIQGGAPKGRDGGGAGYAISDEVWKGASHDQPGLLCMAKEGPQTGSSQFFILDRKLSSDLSYMDTSYTIFGRCSSLDVISKIARVPIVGERPVSPPKLRRVEILRSRTTTQRALPSAATPAGKELPEVPAFGGRE